MHGRTVYWPLEAKLQHTLEPEACFLSVHVLRQRHPALHSPSKLSLHRPESQHHEAIVLRNFCERNSFSGARFRLRWRWGMFLGMIQPGGGLTSVWAQSRHAAASKRFCDESPPPTSSVVEADIPTQRFWELCFKRPLVSSLVESQGSSPKNCPSGQQRSMIIIF